SIFRNSRVVSISRANGKVMSVSFELDGQQFMGLNAGPQFRFNEAVSFFVNCETQAEVDELWRGLSEGGEESRCGWVKDKFGLWWQVNPSTLRNSMNDPDLDKSKAVVQAMMGMTKIIIEDLQKAHATASPTAVSR